MIVTTGDWNKNVKNIGRNPSRYYLAGEGMSRPESRKNYKNVKTCQIQYVPINFGLRSHFIKTKKFLIKLKFVFLLVNN